MNMKKLLITLGLLGVVLNSCEPYEDYTEDFDKTTVYFATQKPLRSIVSYNEMAFKVGVALGGKRGNNKEEFADFVIDETLLTTVAGADVFTLLPESYYTLSNASKMIIPSGKFIGDVTVTLNRDLFTNDTLSMANTYALPIRITNVSLDSIGGFDSDGTVLDLPKDYTILVVKYISQYSGTYYHKGTQNEVDSSGTVINQTVYNESDLIKNQTWGLTTIDRNSVKTPGIGSNSSQNFIVNVNEADNTVSIGSPSGGVTNLVGSGTVNDDRSISLNYSYTFGDKNFEVEETLVLRRPPEEDLGFEEW
jgi:hypothetical protein